MCPEKMCLYSPTTPRKTGLRWCVHVDKALVLWHHLHHPIVSKNITFEPSKKSLSNICEIIKVNSLVRSHKMSLFNNAFNSRCYNIMSDYMGNLAAQIGVAKPLMIPPPPLLTLDSRTTEGWQLSSPSGTCYCTSVKCSREAQ